MNFQDHPITLNIGIAMIEQQTGPFQEAFAHSGKVQGLKPLGDAHVEKTSKNQSFVTPKASRPPLCFGVQ
jgi:hypothetical protein